MQLTASSYEVINMPTDFEQPDDVTEYFSLTASSYTRLSRRSPQEDEFTVPMILRRARTPFVLCEVTVSGDYQTDWDQGGLVIFLGDLPGQQQPGAFRRPHVSSALRLGNGSSKWARVGVELTRGELSITTLVANTKCGNDWASTPAFPLSRPNQRADFSLPSFRLKLERVGSDLWIWFMMPDMSSDPLGIPTPEFVSRQWRKCREIAKFFDDAYVKEDVYVGCYASRPVQAENLPDDDGLFVEFEDFEIL